MNKISQHIPLKINYDIHFTRGLFSAENPLLKRLFAGEKPGVLVFIDAAVARAIPEIQAKIARRFRQMPATASLIAAPVRVPGGESCKTNLRHVQAILRHIRRANLDRHSYVMAVGGGAVLDAVGFAAAITHRGIRHVRVPTTVLAQCDSGVGVKNSINFGGLKNYYGTFTPPAAVVNDFDFLRTLDDASWRSGIAEAFKVAIIKDRQFFDFLCAHADALRRRDMAAMERLIRRSAALHAAHIATAGDPFETGSARPLDFGHWSAHALETISRYRVSHGVAVAIGMALDLCIARTRSLVTERDAERLFSGLEACGFILWHPALESTDSTGKLAVYRGLEDFRLHLGGKLTVILPNGIGKTTTTGRITYGEVVAAVKTLKHRHSGTA